jgi:hypothetical protein
VTTETPAQVSHEAIANLARQIWEREGRQPGRDMDYWLQAEREVRARQGRNPTSAPPTTSRTNKGPSSRVIRI